MLKILPLRLTCNLGPIASFNQVLVSSEVRRFFSNHWAFQYNISQLLKGPIFLRKKKLHNIKKIPIRTSQLYTNLRHKTKAHHPKTVFKSRWISGSSLGAQQVEDSALSPMWCRFNPWPWHFHMRPPPPQKRISPHPKLFQNNFKIQNNIEANTTL